MKDWLKQKDGKAFDRAEYRDHPDRYESTFSTDVAPYTTLFINGGFWEPGCPRLMTTKQLAEVQATAPKGRFLSIVDIGCDWGVSCPSQYSWTKKLTSGFAGSLRVHQHAHHGRRSRGPLQCFDRGVCTRVSAIFRVWSSLIDGDLRSPATASTTQISAVEIYPSTLPLDASEHFSDAIFPYVRALIADPTCSGKDELSVSLRNAIIAEDGQLLPRHAKLYELLKQRNSDDRRRKVVLLGSG